MMKNPVRTPEIAEHKGNRSIYHITERVRAMSEIRFSGRVDVVGAVELQWIQKPVSFQTPSCSLVHSASFQLYPLIPHYC